MADETDKPVDRDAWRGLLAQGGDEPSELTDARVRAAARRAIPPRAAGWWLPASLAASMLLAVLVVQWQYEARGPAAVLLESEVAAPAADSAPAADAAFERLDEPALKRESDLYYLDMTPRTPPPAIDLPAANESRAVQGVPAEESRRAEVETPVTAGTSQSVIPPGAALLPPPVTAPEPAPVREAAARKSAADKAVGEIIVTGSRQRATGTEASTPVTAITQQDIAGAYLGNLQKTREGQRPPEEWYAEIEKLRVAGRKEEAERELEKLEAAHPGWLEEHLKQEQKKE